MAVTEKFLHILYMSYVQFTDLYFRTALNAFGVTIL